MPRRWPRLLAGVGRRRARQVAGGWLVAALAVGLVGAVSALRQVEPGFVRTHPELELGRPERWAADPRGVAPGTLGRVQWTGRAPLEARLGPVAAGDILKLKLRADARGGPRPVVVSLDGRPVTVLHVDDTWRQFEVATPYAGRLLRLELFGGPPVAVHLSRVSATNVLHFSEGLLQLHVLPATAAPPAPATRAAPRLVALAAAVLLALLVAWRRLLGAFDPAAGLRAAVLELLPGVTLLAAATVVGLAGGPRLVCAPGSFLLLIAVPPVLVEAVRERRRLGRAVRRLVQGLAARIEPVAAPLEAAARRLGLPRWSAAAVETNGLAPRDARRALAAHLAVVGALGLVLAGLVIRDFRGPMLGRGDLAIWTFQGYYLGHNLSFTPLPHLDLVNDQLFYPYGGNNVFQPWVLEVALLSAIADRIVGAGPWYQVYFLLSVLVAAIGAFLLLLREHGAYRASLVAIAVSFCSFYALAKFPGHYGLTCIHWLTLNLLADWVLLRRFVAGRPWSARLLAVRALLLALVLGLDLSYIAGIALTSFGIVALTIVVTVVARAWRQPVAPAAQVRAWFQVLRRSFGEHRAQVAALLAATALVACLWVPIVLQIREAAHAFDLAEMPRGVALANPVRMVFPVLPGLDPVVLGRSLKDHPEAIFAASPGLFFVLFAVAGVAAGRRRALGWLPFLVLLALLLPLAAVQLAALRVFPWFPLVRISGRFSTAYPTILAILGLSLPAGVFRGRRGMLLALSGVLLLAVEAVTAYRIGIGRPRTVYHPDTELSRLVGAIRLAPGEAVLDWPFCLAGGNGVGTGALCPYYGFQAGNTMFFQQLHDKKGVANYFGRLHPDQLRPYQAAGLPRLFFPDSPDAHRATRQHRDFRPGEWEFLERFFVLSDFCGVLLYSDRLPAETVDGFHRRFGAPEAVAERTPFGRLEFIRKRPAWRARVDRAAAVALELPFVPPPPPAGRLEMSDPAASEYLLAGWGGLQPKRRSSEGGFADVAFSLGRVGPLRLGVKGNTFQRQRVRIVLNGALVEEVAHDGSRFVVHEVELPAALLGESNVLRFELPDAHSPKSAGINEDTRRLGVTVEWLELGPA